MDIIVLIRTCRRKEGKREEADATWRCRVSRCMRVCVCELCDVMLVTHECIYSGYGIPLCERNEKLKQDTKKTIELSKRVII